MKKILSLALVLVMVAMALVACGSKDPKESDGKAMTYAQYTAAETDSAVVIDAYVQGKQSWWEKDGQGRASLYLADKDGAYFAYEVFMTEEDFNKLAVGTKIRVTGTKTEWSGEVEIASGATMEFFTTKNDTYVAKAVDLTSVLALKTTPTDSAEELITYQNQLVAFKNLTVVASNEDGAAFLYNWNGSGSREANSDLYFNVECDGNQYTFTVESYLCDNTTDVYKAVEALKVGDTIDVEGFLYWYNGANPHITSVTKK